MREKEISKFGAITVREGTQSLWDYNTSNEHTELLTLFLHLGNDYIRTQKEVAKETLVKIYSDAKEGKEVDFVKVLQSKKGDRLLDVKFYERHFSEMAYCRAVDNFNTYFKDILAEIVIKEPRILKSKEQERLDFILEYDNMNDLLKAIAEKKIEQLFYGGLSDIDKFFKDRIGISIFKDSIVENSIRLFVKQRNLIVHNRGKISKEFANEFQDGKFEPDKYLALTYDYISRTNLYLNNFVIEMDIEIASKFGLEVKKYPFSENLS